MNENEQEPLPDEEIVQGELEEEEEEPLPDEEQKEDDEEEVDQSWGEWKGDGGSEVGHGVEDDRCGV